MDVDLISYSDEQMFFCFGSKHNLHTPMFHPDKVSFLEIFFLLPHFKSTVCGEGVELFWGVVASDNLC